MVNPAWLKSFATLAHVGNFTRAAERLGVTQAAISQHVRRLEDQFGPVVIRRSRGIELTPGGHALLAYASEMDLAGARLAQRLGDTDELKGEVTVVTPGSVGLWAYPVLLSLQQAHPGLAIRHRFAPDPGVLEDVLAGRSEIGVVTTRPNDERLHATHLAEDALELVVPAGRSVKAWSDLEALGFIDHPDGVAMATRLLARMFPGNKGVRSLPQHGFTNQIGLILEPVARGLGFTVIPQYARRAFTNTAAIKVLICGAPVRDTLWIVRRSEWPLSQRAARVVAELMLAAGNATA
ncbi:DNA-binding transcriptional LysR family regulator [Luteibacter sp. Sphag1AF]|uniref:LysR family transcriptional regulator n=1 Tax=Luteibacter sp. Sphag1AF TaxID=2587031 RepID=UPI00160E2C5C|nr:LysR family transcriptional regulator [Luteibacter sp. Sphag1AF]MBB3226458.1 DNA-binding transcriptional LysR family regulator [Luteibacter sp. Sphag1AF]